VDQSTFVSRLAGRLNITSSDSLYSSLDEYVNEALHYLETTADEGYPWYRQRLTLTTTASTQEYSFDTIGALATPDITVSSILDCAILIQSTVYQPLDLVNWETADQSYGAQNTDLPVAWLAEGRTLYLFPIPDAAYTVKVRVVGMENDLGGSTSTPVLPTYFHSAVIDAALLIAYQDLQDVNRMDVQQRRVDEWVSRMKRYGNEHASAPRMTVRDPLWI
jgi:hypothetical protein